MMPETSSIFAILQFLEYSDPVYNITQCILWKSSKFHWLNPPQKEVIEKMVDFIQLLSIQGRITHAQYLTSNSETHTQETIVCTLSNGSSPT